MVLSSGAPISSVAASSAWPKPSRAPQRLMLSDAVARQHLGVVVEHQVGAQRDAPGLAVVLADGALGHLRLRLVVAVEAEQRVEYQEAVIARLVGRGPDRIEHGEVGLGHELQYLRGFAAGDGGRGEHGGGGGKECAAAHDGPPGG